MDLIKNGVIQITLLVCLSCLKKKIVTNSVFVGLLIYLMNGESGLQGYLTM